MAEIIFFAQLIARVNSTRVKKNILWVWRALRMSGIFESRPEKIQEYIFNKFHLRCSVDLHHLYESDDVWKWANVYEVRWCMKMSKCLWSRLTEAWAEFSSFRNRWCDHGRNKEYWTLPHYKLFLLTLPSGCVNQ